VEGKTATVGITDHAQEQLGEITFVELPRVGKDLRQRQELGVVESSKAAADVYAPVAGRVVEVNAELEGKPELINQDCYGAGWLCRLERTQPDDLQNLLTAAAYADYLKSLET
jgi:glycine cleavage system H protein